MTGADSDSPLATDPVCGMQVDSVKSDHRYDWRGNSYYFCCARCRDRFADDPASFLQPRAATVDAGNGPYTCPMHPEVLQDGPGICPECGMALEPLEPSAQRGEPNPELTDFQRRLRIGARLAVGNEPQP